jgi:hypothetical protein
VPFINGKVQFRGNEGIIFFSGLRVWVGEGGVRWGQEHLGLSEDSSHSFILAFPQRPGHRVEEEGIKYQRVI